MTFVEQMIEVKPVIDFPGLERILKATGGTPLKTQNGFMIPTDEIQLQLARDFFLGQDTLSLYFKKQDQAFRSSFKRGAFPTFFRCDYIKADGLLETRDPSNPDDFSYYHEQFTNGATLLNQAVKKYDLKDLYKNMPK